MAKEKAADVASVKRPGDGNSIIPPKEVEVQT
jgi:hypothetical protein